MNTATKIKDLDNFTGEAALFRLSPPLVQTDYEGKKSKHEYVIVSATVAMFSGPETYIFPAKKNGQIASWVELGGSYRGGLSMERALRKAGYSVVEPKAKAAPKRKVKARA